MKKLIAAILIASFGIMIIVPAAYAGDRQRARWEGVAIGIGSLLLLKTIFDHTKPYPVPAPPPVVVTAPPAPGPIYTPGPPPVYEPAPPPPQRTWIPGHYEDKWVPGGYWVDEWVPGHYDHRGYWVPGHYVKKYKENGYWTKLWVEGHWE